MTVDLSVVIAAYNAADTLGEQLAALARQQVAARWDVIVADNGSTDRTREVAATWTDRLPGLRVIDASARRGAGAARNLGVEVATGRDVVFCDADDVVADDWLAALHAALRSRAFVAGRFDDTLLNTARVRRSRALPQRDGLQTSAHLPGLRHAGAGNLGLRRELFQAVGGFDPDARYLEDTDLCWRVQLAGVPLIWTPQALVHVRLRGTLRSALGQGYHYGSGERWLARRYREQSGPTPAACTLPDPMATSGDSVPSVRPHRLLHRAAATTRALAGVRTLGDLGAWCWDLGWGIGYACAPVGEPEPVRIDPVGGGVAV
ncbi:glycosyltransferase [Cellulomonas sp. NPDC089187]|uniref:glycosyltransferase family 2 protein n=1 Tax=Cellulomonas sp. NPDC089187 TaxID=3154970 RepID=UPI003443ABBE